MACASICVQYHGSGLGGRGASCILLTAAVVVVLAGSGSSGQGVKRRWGGGVARIGTAA